MGSFLPDMTIIVREVAQSGANIKFIAPAWAVTAKLIDALGPEVTEGIMSADYVSAGGGGRPPRFSPRLQQGSPPRGAATNYSSLVHCSVDTLALSQAEA